MVVLPQGTYRLAEFGEVAQFVEVVPGVRGQRAEQVGAQHRRDHRAEPARGFAHGGAGFTVGDGAVTLVHPRHDLVAQVGVVAAGAR